MRNKSFCIMTAIILAISTAAVGCGGSASGAQSQQQVETKEPEAAAETVAEVETPAPETPAPDAAQQEVVQTAAEVIPKPEPEPIPEPEPEPELPRSPLTGKVMDEELLKQRPLAVMYPINQQAQPQYGLDRVDVFYEIMEEGNMSRQMGIMQDWQDLERIGNIRSIRSYFVYEALEWDPIIIHFGGPVDYTGEILTRDDVDNINGVGGVMGSDYGAFYRVPRAGGIKDEHTAYTDAEHVLDAIDEAGFEKEHREEYYHDKHFTFTKDGEINDLSQYPDAVDATEIDMEGSYPVTRSALYYDEDDHLYYKTLYGNDQCDAVTGEQMAFTNIFIQRCAWTHVTDESAYLWFRIEEPEPGVDDGFYITNGKMIHVTWDKADDYEPTIYYDDNGNEVTVNQGRTMVFIIRDDTDWFEIDGTYYDPDDHHTIIEEEEEESDEGDTSHEVSEVEEPEEEEM